MANSGGRLSTRVCQGVQEGIHTFVNAIRPTLGPIHRMVAIEKPFKVERPELLDEGAVIARRIIQLLNREEDMGRCIFAKPCGQCMRRLATATVPMPKQTKVSEVEPPREGKM